MRQKDIYLDHAATTAVLPQVAKDVADAMTNNYGNPSSAHHKGIEAERIVADARNHIAASIGVPPEQIIFTSGGTESNNLALFGVARARKGRGRHIVTTAIEHPSILNALSRLEEEGFDVTRVPVDETGFTDPDIVVEALRTDTILLSVGWINNEVGTINPIADIAAKAKQIVSHLVIHSDAVQAFGKMPLHPTRAGIDLMSLSGHKLHAPKGIGALWVDESTHLSPLLFGGEQEQGLRSGTENVPGIVGFGSAVRSIVPQVVAGERDLRELRKVVIDGLGAVDDSRLNGRRDRWAAPHIVNYSFAGVQGEVLVRLLASKGVFVSSGSACSSRRTKSSHVLQALSLPDWAINGSIRISLSPLTRRRDIDVAVDAVKNAVSELRRGKRR